MSFSLFIFSKLPYLWSFWTWLRWIGSKTWLLKRELATRLLAGASLCRKLLADRLHVSFKASEPGFPFWSTWEFEAWFLQPLCWACRCLVWLGSRRKWQSGLDGHHLRMHGQRHIQVMSTDGILEGRECTIGSLVFRLRLRIWLLSLHQMCLNSATDRPLRFQPCYHAFRVPPSKPGRYVL